LEPASRLKQILSQAEASYWKLALDRQIVKVQQEALDRAKKIYFWNLEKAKLHLRENSDVLQAEALAKSRELSVLNRTQRGTSCLTNIQCSSRISGDEIHAQNWMKFQQKWFKT
jgi:hypothetical protein